VEKGKEEKQQSRRKNLQSKLGTEGDEKGQKIGRIRQAWPGKN